MKLGRGLSFRKPVRDGWRRIDSGGIELRSRFLCRTRFPVIFENTTQGFGIVMFPGTRGRDSVHSRGCFGRTVLRRRINRSADLRYSNFSVSRDVRNSAGGAKVQGALDVSDLVPPLGTHSEFVITDVDTRKTRKRQLRRLRDVGIPDSVDSRRLSPILSANLYMGGSRIFW